MPLHGFIDIQRMHRWSVKTCEPHIAHNHQLERILRIFHALGEFAALLLGRMVFGQQCAIVTRCSHHHLHLTLHQIIRMPIRAQSRHRLVQLRRNPS